jgi:hypothetical protein
MSRVVSPLDVSRWRGVLETDAMTIAQPFMAGYAHEKAESVKRTTEIFLLAASNPSAVRFTDSLVSVWRTQP